MNLVRLRLSVVATVFALGSASCAFAADGGIWSVSKSSGEVWIGSGDVQQATLGPEDNLKPGDTVRTGRTGRVLLTRGEESILIAPNSVVGVPAEQKDGMSTTIVQQAGSILLEVEKRNVKHFEVETPYLAAVVKGTQFRVSINGASTSVDVVRGQVEVTDFKSGQIAEVLPGQKVTAFEHGKAGLSLSGSGRFNPIEQGKPRSSSVNRIQVPRTGLSAPRNAKNGQEKHVGSDAHGKLRISTTLGDLKLDFHKVTHGLAHDRNVIAGARNTAGSDTVWNSSQGNVTAASVSSGGMNAALSNSSAPAATAATIGSNSGNSSVASSSNGAFNRNGNGNGKGNAVGGGNGNGHGNGGAGNGRGNGDGNGHGNGGVGNGNGNGNLKH